MQVFGDILTLQVRGDHLLQVEVEEFKHLAVQQSSRCIDMLW